MNDPNKEKHVLENKIEQNWKCVLQQVVEDSLIIQ